MGRDIKFRVWDEGTCFSLSEALFNELLVVQHNREDCFAIEKIYDFVVIEQYTGLKDKNGVEIYEGDIVSITTIDNYTHQPIHISNKAVKYNEITAGFDNAIHFCGVEVVGNIHQNPELLK